MRKLEKERQREAKRDEEAKRRVKTALKRAERELDDLRAAAARKKGRLDAERLREWALYLYKSHSAAGIGSCADGRALLEDILEEARGFQLELRLSR